MQSSNDFRPQMVSHHYSISYESSAVDLMLNQYAAFSPLRRRYFMIYQSIIPNCQRCLAILREQCDIPEYMESHILAGGSRRICSQRILNFLLTKFVKDRDYNEFCDLIKMLMDFVYLRLSVDRLREELSSCPYASQGKLFMWFPPPLKVFHDEACQLIPADFTSLKTFVDPRYHDRQRRRINTAATEAKIEPKQDLNLSIGQDAATILIPEVVLNSPKIDGILKDFPQLKVHYSALLQSLPVNFTETVGHLEHYLTATAIFKIVSSPDADQGNREIMNCLIRQLKHQEDIFELCNQLEEIPNAPALSLAIEELRKGIKGSEDVFHVAEVLQPDNIGSEILKKYYHQLYESFPSDIMVTLGTLVQLITLDDQVVDWILSPPTTTLIVNQRILDYLILTINGRYAPLEFCDKLEEFIDKPALLKLVQNLRNELLEVLEDNNSDVPDGMNFRPVLSENVDFLIHDHDCLQHISPKVDPKVKAFVTDKVPTGSLCIGSVYGSGVRFCSNCQKYLISSELVISVHDLSAMQYQHLIDNGWYRRGGVTMYRLREKHSMKCCDWETRVNALQFDHTKSKTYRKVLRKMPDNISIKTSPAYFNREAFNLYNSYHASKHQKPDRTEPSYANHAVHSPYEHQEGKGGVIYGTYHQEYYLGDKLVAVGVIDVVPYGVVSVYMWYDNSKDVNKYSFGVYSVIKEIEYARSLAKCNPDIKYYYLQGWNPLNRKLAYKVNYSPMEFFCPCISTKWIPNVEGVEECIENRPASSKNAQKLLSFNQSITFKAYNSGIIQHEACHGKVDINTIPVCLLFSTSDVHTFMSLGEALSLYDIFGGVDVVKKIYKELVVALGQPLAKQFYLVFKVKERREHNYYRR